MPSRDLQACDVRLREAYMRGKLKYERDMVGAVLVQTCTHRSVQEQQQLYAQGRTRPGLIVTQVDGVTKLSNHNYAPARAIDFCVTWGGKVSWQADDYGVAGPYFEAEGLVWGGSWPTFKDWPHVEMPPEWT